LITISISPIAFTIGELSVRWYGVMVALAVIVLILWMVWQIRRGADISYDRLLTVALIAIPSGIIVSRLLHVIDQWSYYFQDIAHLRQIVGAGGLTIWGAILGATLGIWVYSRFSDFKFGYFMDLVAPGVLLAQVIGRVGCTINGCCYGKATSLPWGVVYTDPDSFAPLGIAVHPTQVYEIVFLLIVFGVLFWLRRRFQPEGSLFLIYLSLYSVWRLGVGFLRDGTDFLFGLHQAQVVGIVVLLIVVPMLVLRTRWVRVKSRLNDERYRGY
jgi:phosphatidylglycerol:prolipoprotein diacylglycerol transferase